MIQVVSMSMQSEQLKVPSCLDRFLRPIVHKETGVSNKIFTHATVFSSIVWLHVLRIYEAAWCGPLQCARYPSLQGGLS